MKKLTKILSAVALCGVGAVTLAGCTDINLSQAQMDKIITVVDNSDKFMKDTTDYLQNRDKQSIKTYAYELLRLAEGKMILHVDGLLNNIRVNQSYTTKDSHETSTIDIVMLDNTHYAFLTKSSEWGEDYELEYNYTKQEGESQKEMERIYYSSEFRMGYPVENTEPVLYEHEFSVESSYLASFSSIFTFTRQFNLKAEDIGKVDVLENGNYVIYAFGCTDPDEESKTSLAAYITIELTENAEIVRLEATCGNVVSTGNYVGELTDFTNSFTYHLEKGSADKDEILEKINIANEFAKTQG